MKHWKRLLLFSKPSSSKTQQRSATSGSIFSDFTEEGEDSSTLLQFSRQVNRVFIFCINSLILPRSDVCAWSNWTSCEWFCDEKDPGNTTRRLQAKDNETSQNVAHLCNEQQTLGCYENCTGKSFVVCPFVLLFVILKICIF